MNKHLKSALTIFGIIMILVLFVYESWGSISTLPFFPFTSRLDRAAQKVMVACSAKTYKPPCYDEEIPKLMDEGFTMEEGFQVTKLIQNKDSTYYYCHVLGHNLSARETAKDPSDWPAVISRCPIGMCSNGCLHGAFQERFRDEVLTAKQIDDLLPQLKTICEQNTERNFTGLEQASCYHAMGHLTMYITGANPTLATGICDKLARQNGADYTQTCYEGAYMQIFQPLEPEDFTLVKDIAPATTVAAEKFCDTYTAERRSACHRESWPLYRESMKTPEGLQSFCSLVPDATSTQRCYNAAFYLLAAQFQFEEPRITPLCEGLPEKRKAQCFGNSASRFIETDYRLTPRAVGLCKVAEKDGVGDRCYKELLFYSWFNFHKDSDAFKTLCAALPEPWSTKCFAGEGKNAHPSAGDY